MKLNKKSSYTSNKCKYKVLYTVPDQYKWNSHIAETNKHTNANWFLDLLWMFLIDKWQVFTIFHNIGIMKMNLWYTIWYVPCFILFCRSIYKADMIPNELQQKVVESVDDKFIFNMSSEQKNLIDR